MNENISDIRTIKINDTHCIIFGVFWFSFEFHVIEIFSKGNVSRVFVRKKIVYFIKANGTPFTVHENSVNHQNESFCTHLK